MRRIIVLSLLVFAGCAEPQPVDPEASPPPTRGPGPEAVLSAYLSAVTAGRFGEAYTHLSRSDHRRVPRERYLAEKLYVDRGLSRNGFGGILRSLGFTIQKVTIRDHRALGAVVFQTGDSRIVLRRLLGERAERILSDPTELAAFEDLLKDGLRARVHYDLVEEEGRWKVSLAWTDEELTSGRLTPPAGDGKDEIELVDEDSVWKMRFEAQRLSAKGKLDEAEKLLKRAMKAVDTQALGKALLSSLREQLRQVDQAREGLDPVEDEKDD